MKIFFEKESLRHRAEELGAQLKLPVIYMNQLRDSAVEEETFNFLFLSEDRLELKKQSRAMKPIFVDFSSDALQFRLKNMSIKKEALARAAGLKKNKNPVVFDLTAGLGRDSYILAAFGCQVHLFERNPIVHALLADGLERAERDANDVTTNNKMTLYLGNARHLMKQLSQHISPDVIYMDPMFPHRTKSSLVKKEMRLVRELVGDDPDADLLLEESLEIAGNRVVCKRPRQAPFLARKKPTMSIKTKKHRFDVYLV